MPVGRSRRTPSIADRLIPYSALLAGGWTGITIASALLLLDVLLASAIVVILFRRARRLERALGIRDRRAATYLRTLMDTSPEGFWRVDVQGVTIEVNRSMADLLGVTPEEMIGRNFREFLPPESVDAAEEAYRAGLDGVPAQFEITIRRPDGKVLHTLVTTHPILDERGRFVEGFGIIRDISERQRVEAERRHAHSLLEAALDSTADGLLIVDREGRMVRFNERFARMWRIPDEILQSGDDDRALQFVLAQLEEPEEFLSRVRKLYATPEAESFDILRFRDGRVFERTSLPHRLQGKVVGRVWSFRDVTDRERAYLEQHRALERETTIARNLDTALFTFALDPDGRLLRYEYISRGAEALYGHPVRELEQDPGFWFRRVHPEDDRNIVQPAIAKLLRLQPAVIEVRYETSKGIWRWHRSRLTPRLEEDGLVRVDGIETDVTERVVLEEQFRHAQKMEAVGQLAGGVAHDFNNILTAILGYADLLLTRVPKTDPSRPALEEIRKGGERAASLTRQLLAFSRRAATQPREVDVNEAVRNLEGMARRLMGERATLALALDPATGCVRIDPIQLEQVIVNLIVNARDAMPEGGTVLVRTERVVLGVEDVAGEPVLAPGPYVRLRVEDSGVGIPPGILERIFEPFFTTKEAGRGTGLGLAMVYGIVRQHGGRVRAGSDEGQGTSIEIELPERPRGARGEATSQARALPTGVETVFLVEDDPSLLTLAQEALTDLGYRVRSAPDAPSALQMLELERDDVDILVTDVVMPGMGGRELAERARRLRPDLPVLFVSGYTRDPGLFEADETPGVPFLEKPYSSLALAHKVREVLDRAPARSAGGADRVGP